MKSHSPTHTLPHFAPPNSAPPNTFQHMTTAAKNPTQAINYPDGPNISSFRRRLKLAFRPVEYVEDFAKVYGDCFTLKNPSGNHIVYFSHPQALEQIFTADASHFNAGQGNGILRFLFGDNSLVILDGERHQRQRQLLAPPFHGDRMRAYGETIQKITLQITEEWGNGKPFKIRTSMQDITLNVILRAVFGFDEGENLTKISRLLTQMLELVASPVMSVGLFFPFLQADLGAWSPWGRFLRLKKQVDELIYSLIRQRRTENYASRQDILSLLLCARYDDGDGMSDEELHNELMTLLVAGHETTASALVWAFYWLDRLPEVRQKLQKELDNLEENPEPINIAKLPYLTAICQEALRIYPVAMTSFPRVVKSPVTIMGYNLPVGTWIIPSIYMAHHRQEAYPQPKQFRPERFLERQFSPYEYLPFGGGSRRCIGMAFAQYEMKLVLATVLSKYQVVTRHAVSLRVNQKPIKPVRRGLTIAAPNSMKMVAHKNTV